MFILTVKKNDGMSFKVLNVHLVLTKGHSVPLESKAFGHAIYLYNESEKIKIPQEAIEKIDDGKEHLLGIVPHEDSNLFSVSYIGDMETDLFLIEDDNGGIEYYTWHPNSDERKTSVKDLDDDHLLNTFKYLVTKKRRIADAPSRAAKVYQEIQKRGLECPFTMDDIYTKYNVTEQDIIKFKIIGVDVTDEVKRFTVVDDDVAV